VLPALTAPAQPVAQGTISASAQAVVAENPVPEKPVRPAPPPAARAPDYGWVSGELEWHRREKSWRLRYCPVDEVDLYGGSVQLVADDDRLDLLQEGQRVRVTGQLLTPETHTSGAPYRVESLQVLSK